MLEAYHNYITNAIVQFGWRVIKMAKGCIGKLGGIFFTETVKVAVGLGTYILLIWISLQGKFGVLSQTRDCLCAKVLKEKYFSSASLLRPF